MIAAIRYLIDLFDPESDAEIDDIDHLGNRRLRTIDELASEELAERIPQAAPHRAGADEPQRCRGHVAAQLINPKSVSAAIEYFFGRGELSQVVDQTNPLSQLTHERRLSALGPGGLNRKRAGFEVRDVHISHYGRICPIETPEGTNIGLISSLAIYAGVDDYGFLVTPYRKIKKWQSDRRRFGCGPTRKRRRTSLRPTPRSITGALVAGPNMIARLPRRLPDRPARRRSSTWMSPPARWWVSRPGLIPFLEHDDANRALMGSNMQRQAVPLLVAEPPIVGTGMEREVARTVRWSYPRPSGRQSHLL